MTTSENLSTEILPPDLQNWAPEIFDDSERETQILRYRCGGETYGVELDGVHEIVRYTALTQVPNAPPYVAGLLNLRGVVVPVVDLGLKTGLPAKRHDRSSAIIVVDVDGAKRGLLVDQVCDLLSVGSERIQTPPNFGGAVRAEFIRDLIREGDELVINLDVGRLLALAEFQ